MQIVKKKMAICKEIILDLSESLTCKGLAHHQSLELGTNCLGWDNAIKLWLAPESSNAVLMCPLQDIGRWSRPEATEEEEKYAFFTSGKFNC